MSTPEALAEHIRERLGERVLAADVAYDEVTVTVGAADFPAAARFCKTDPELDMRFFDFLAGVDEREEGFAVVARVYSPRHRHSVILRTIVPGGRDEPRMPTITDVYAGANWHERETYDMFGIVFEGHPGLLPRLLTVENFEGWPLRKEFKLQTREVKPWPGAKEPGEPGEPESGAGTAAAVSTDLSAPPKAERAKAKAAEARARKAAERAAALSAEATPAEGEELPADEADAEGARAAQPAAAGQPVPEGTPDPTTPEGAAEVADTAIAKDAAAGGPAGDVNAGAPGDADELARLADELGDEGEPQPDRVQEAAQAEGAAPEPGGSPGVTAEGAGAEDEQEDEG